MRRQLELVGCFFCETRRSLEQHPSNVDDWADDEHQAHERARREYEATFGPLEPVAAAGSAWDKADRETLPGVPTSVRIRRETRQAYDGPARRGWPFKSNHYFLDWPEGRTWRDESSSTSPKPKIHRSRKRPA